MKNIFYKYTSQHGMSEDEVDDLWQVVEKYYKKNGRYYHNLEHLQFVYDQLCGVEDLLKDSSSCMIAVFYHDIIYSIFSKDNEFRSAQFAERQLSKCKALSLDFTHLKELICATQLTYTYAHPDSDFLCDADLAILGSKTSFYEEYRANIRKEYSIYPDFLFNKGRARLLEFLLRQKSLFKTEYFKDKYEELARQNIEKELQIITS